MYGKPNCKDAIPEQVPRGRVRVDLRQGAFEDFVLTDGRGNKFKFYKTTRAVCLLCGKIGDLFLDEMPK